MKTFRIFINSASRTSGTLTDCTVPLNNTLFPKFEKPELRIETLEIDSGLITAPNIIQVSMPNLIMTNMNVFSTTPAGSSVIKSFVGLTYDEETTLNSVGLPIEGANLMNSGFIQIQFLDQAGAVYAVADNTKKWNMTLVIMDRGEK